MTVASAASVLRAEHLYVHVPFCARRCVYCDFSIAVRPRVPVREYVDGIRRELASRHRDSVFDLRTLYLGGGTPSKLGATGVALLLDAVRDHATIADVAEVTLEVNPEDVSRDAVRAWMAAGINRVSLGIQSFHAGTLEWMHRTHDAPTAVEAVHALRDAGMDNVSIDLIFAVPEAVHREWDRDLDIALELDLAHLSVYGLTVEPQTPLGRWVARQDVAEAPEDQFEREFLRAHEALTASGYAHYEISNYARPGRHSVHNRAYWDRVAYGGIGPAAHEFDGRVRRWNRSPFAEWLANSERSGAGMEVLTDDQVLAEQIYLGLRTDAGVPRALAGPGVASNWRDAGWAAEGPDERLRLTPSGWLRIDSLANDLTRFRSR